MRGALQQAVNKAERNKVFREGSYGGLRCVAIDGWEPFASYERHCPQCLVRQVKVKRAGGEVEEVKQYFHRYVVALLLGPVVWLIRFQRIVCGGPVMTCISFNDQAPDPGKTTEPPPPIMEDFKPGDRVMALGNDNVRMTLGPPMDQKKCANEECETLHNQTDQGRHRVPVPEQVGLFCQPS